MSAATIAHATAPMRLPAADAALVGTIYDPPRARRAWRLKDVLPEGPTRYYSLARWALVDALRACGVRAGDRVLVPGLICRDVLASISLLGATAAFYAVSRHLSPVLNADASPAKAILAVNYFGFPQDLAVFRQYSERTGAAVIEDNAHGFLSRDTDGRLLGSRADAAFFSFRKTIPLPHGSALVLHGNREMPHAADAAGVTSPGSRYRLKQAFRRVAGRIGPVRTMQAIGGVRHLRAMVTGEALPRSSPDAETRIPLGPSPCALISRTLAVAEPELESRRRRALYELAGRLLARSEAVPVFPHLPANVVPYGFPFFASPAQAPAIAADVGRCGLQLARWPELPSVVAPSAPEHYRQLMVLPFLW